METKDFEITVPYGPVTVHENHTINRLRIKVQHVKGDRSVRVDITPIEYDEEWHSYSILCDGKREHQGFYVTVLTGQMRKPTKKMSLIFSALTPYTSRIADLFLQGEYGSIANTITELVKDLDIK